MKFRISNKEGILNVLSEVEQKMNELRFMLTHLPQEFEIAQVEENEDINDG